MIGVPSSAGAHHAGQELAPDAIRAAGLLDRLAAAGAPIGDAGNLPGAVFAPDRAHPGGRNLPAVARVAAEVADSVSEVVASGRRPLLVGGDCTITLGAIAGFRRVRSDVSLVYVDGDADLGTPGDGGSGIFDSMGVSHLLGRGAPELAFLSHGDDVGAGGRDASHPASPLLESGKLAILGSDPRETSEAGRRYLHAAGVHFQEAPELIADPAAAAERALHAVTGSSDTVVVHFDVDTVDSGDLPLGNFPHYGSGVRLDDAVACLSVLCRHPSFAGLVLTEVNPTHDPAGSELARLVDGLVMALTSRNV